MAKEIKKDIIVRRVSDGLYAMMAGAGKDFLRWTNKANADHFTGKAAAKRSLPGLEHFTVEFKEL